MRLAKMRIRMSLRVLPTLKLMLTPLRQSSMIKLKMSPLRLFLMITSRPALIVKLRTG